jgi:transposase-like protein
MLATENLVSREEWHLAYGRIGLLDLQARFPTDEKCREYLANVRYPGGFLCPRCGSPAAGEIQTRHLWQCKRCRGQVSLTAGTLFHKSRTSLREWFWAIFLVACDKRGHSALQLSKELGIPYVRAWLMLHRIRTAMANRDARYRLSGIVEMDEAYFGAPDPGRRGRGTRRAKAIVALGLREAGKPRFVRIRMVKRLDARAVEAFAEAAITPGSTIRTDGLTVYSGLSKQGFQHVTTIAPGKTKDDVLYWTHIIISNAKAFIAGTFHGLPEKHIQRYLDEFCYRFNRRHREGELFDRLLLACATAPAVTRDELTT